jgi:hypothetical protein
VVPRAVLDAVVKRKIPSPRRESNLRILIIQPVAKRERERQTRFHTYIKQQIQL